MSENYSNIITEIVNKNHYKAKKLLIENLTTFLTQLKNERPQYFNALINKVNKDKSIIPILDFYFKEKKEKRVFSIVAKQMKDKTNFFSFLKNKKLKKGNGDNNEINDRKRFEDKEDEEELELLLKFQKDFKIQTLNASIITYEINSTLLAIYSSLPKAYQEYLIKRDDVNHILANYQQNLGDKKSTTDLNVDLKILENVIEIADINKAFFSNTSNVSENDREKQLENNFTNIDENDIKIG